MRPRRDLIFRTSCMIEGTKTRLASAAAVKGAKAGAVKLGAAEAAASVMDGMVSLASKVADAAESPTAKAILPTATERTIKVDVTVDLIKELNVEEVDVKIKDFHTDVVVAEKVLGVKLVRNFVERAISAKASEVATRMARERTNRFMSRFQCCY
ncbi:unnamed protein product [Effrenium voratum]|nr:unnamed protein product [Effrenium voratum]